MQKIKIFFYTRIKKFETVKERNSQIILQENGRRK